MSLNDESYKKQWDQRYSEEAFAYGKAPNDFFRDQLQLLSPGSILMPADGEGRNGVYAATLGWEVTAVDLSVEGRAKALRLADEMDVRIEYLVGDLESLGFQQESFDAIGLIYAHFLANKKSSIHRKLSTFLKPGGWIIFEAFSKNHLEYVKANPKVGGPRDIEMLFSKDELASDFANYDIKMLEEIEVVNEEGRYHSGASSVIRLVGIKN
ncbi:MAG: class I SAM-dependent methyltransferase [Chryseolinea sp.]